MKRIMGVVVVVVAVIGTAIIGSIASVERVSEPTTSYDYVSDISGLFEYTTAPEFVEYNPPENWTGYYTNNPANTSGITYIESDRQTRYPVKIPVETTTGTISLGSGQSYTQPYIVYYINPGETFQEWQYSIGGSTNVLKNAYFDDVIERLTLPDDTAMLTFDVGEITDLNPVLVNLSQMDLGITDHAYYYLNTERYTYNHTTGVVTAVGANNTVIWRTDASNVLITWGGELRDRPFNNLGALKSTFPYTLTPVEPIIYMDVSEGVGVETADVSVNWGNGYNNSEISTLIRFPSTSGEFRMIADLYDYNGEQIVSNGRTLKVSVDVVKTNLKITTTCTLLRYAGPIGAEIGSVSIITTGSWQSVLVTLDTIGWNLTVSPVAGTLNGFDFSEYKVFSGQTVNAWSTTELTEVPAVINQALVRASDLDIRFGIVSTKLYMNTNQIVLQNPSIDIRDYFQDEYPRLDLDSFAYYGDSITINRMSWTVDDGRVTITENGDSRTITLESVSIRWGSIQDPNAVTVIFNGEYSTNAGPIRDYTFTAGGTWYFTTSYYAGEQGTTYTYSWNPGTWAYSNDNAAIAAYLGLLVVTTLCATKVIGRPGALDLLIIALAGAVGFVILM